MERIEGVLSILNRLSMKPFAPVLTACLLLVAESGVSGAPDVVTEAIREVFTQSK